VVFVVNLGKGSGGLPPAIRIVTEDGDGQPSVAVGEAEAELDDELKAREREETKRLLYVAVTRARDRLYLSTVVHPAGKTSWAHGSLGRVLSDDVRRLFDQAVAARSPIVWTGPGGRHHEFRVHTPPPADAPIDVMADELMDRPAPIDLELLVDAERIDRVPVTAYLTDSGESGRATTGGARRFEADTEYLVTGTLVHRLLQFDPAPDEAADDPAQLTRRAFALLRPEERVDLEDPDAVVERALAVFEAIRSRPEVAGRAVGGQAFDEVPFSLRVSPALIVRGAIDRLVRGPGPAATVLEFKTGGPKPEHRAQLDLYLDAIRALLPDVAVDGEVIYPVVDG